LGFILGNLVETYRGHAGIIGGIKNFPLDKNGDGVLDLLIDAGHDHCFADGPENCLNYLSIHDGLTLWDKINVLASGPLEEKKKLFKQALAMLLTSQGKIIIQGGTEFAHSKPFFGNDPHPDRVETSSKVIPLGNVYSFHENSYQSPDCTNLILWKRKNAFMDVYNYLKDLIFLRKNIPCLHYSTAEDIRNHLNFVGENLYYTIDENLKLKTWDKLDSFTIAFINGPVRERLFLIGEVHPVGSSKNPEQNKYYVDFDSFGKGEVVVRREDLDFEAWGDSKSVQIKLVKYPGRWDFPSSSYTELGSNTIEIGSINPILKKTVIDLSIINHRAGELPIKYNSYIAYLLDSEVSPSGHPDLAKFNKFLVIHNCAGKFNYFERRDFFHDYRDVKVIMDGMNMDTTGIKNSSILVNRDIIAIPGHTSVILGII
jgi:hypothetical protein